MIKSNITAVDSSYVPPKTEYKKNEAGNYTTKRIEFWKGKTKKRYVKKQKNGWSARFNFILNEGGKQAHYPLYNEIPMLALAFIRKANASVVLPEQPPFNDASAVASYLEQVENIVNGLGVDLNITINDDGFVRSVEGMVIPDDIYFWRIIKVLSEDETAQPSWREQPFDEHTELYVDYLCEILRPIEEGGADSPYCGATFRLVVPYKFIYDPEENRVDWDKTDGGAITAPASRHGKLWTISAAGMFSDPNIIAYWNNPHNYVPLWMSHVDSQVAFKSAISFVVSESGFSQYVADLDNVVGAPLPKNIIPVKVVGKLGTPVPVTATQQQGSPEPTPVSEAVDVQVVQPPQLEQETNVTDTLDVTKWDAEARKILGEILVIWAGEPVLDDRFAPVNKPWLKANLGPLKKQGLIQGGSISSFNYMTVNDVVGAIVGNVDLGDNHDSIATLQQKLIALPLEQDEELVVEEDEDDEDF